MGVPRTKLHLNTLEFDWTYMQICQNSILYSKQLWLGMSNIGPTSWEPLTGLLIKSFRNQQKDCWSNQLGATD